MKKLFAICLVLVCFVSQSAEWKIHAAQGTNPWLLFNRCNNGEPEVYWTMYGLDGGDLSDWGTYTNADMWLGWLEVPNTYPIEWTRLVSGALTLSDEWTVSAGQCGSVSMSGMWWNLYDGAPLFGGYGEYYAGDLVVGEYWIDWNPTEIGVMRVSSIAPSEFGKYLSDGSINPNYVEPLAPVAKRGKGHKK